MSIRQRNAHFKDWAAVCKALNVNTESEARAALESSDNTFYYYVCYIKSTKEIYTHGQIYNCSGTSEEILNLINALTEEVAENEEVTAKALSDLNENKASRGEVEMFATSKQDTISDLETIREGASKGATAVQPSDIPEETYLADFTMASLRQGMNNEAQVSCDMNSLIEAMAANKTILVREDEESAGYKGVYVLNGYAEDLLYFSIVDSIGNVLYCNGTSCTNTSNYIDGSTLYEQRWEDKGTYSKPSGGIPKSDLASDVQGVINNAVTKKIFSDLEYIETQAIASKDFVYALPDTANGDEDDILLSKNTVKTINGERIYGSGDITISGGSGTITEIKANGTSVATSGVANIPAASTTAYGVTKLSSSTSDTSTTLAATASAVKAAYDLANSKQAKLTSGRNIMTARGQSILTSGDLFDTVIISTNTAGPLQTTVGKCYIYTEPQTTEKIFVLSAPNNI